MVFVNILNLKFEYGIYGIWYLVFIQNGNK
jgi:hypothetical protein